MQVSGPRIGIALLFAAVVTVSTAAFTQGQLGFGNFKATVTPSTCSQTCTRCPAGAPNEWKISVPEVETANGGSCAFCASFAGTGSLIHAAEQWANGCRWADTRLDACSPNDRAWTMIYEQGVGWIVQNGTDGIVFEHQGTWNCFGSNTFTRYTGVETGSSCTYPKTIVVSPVGTIQSCTTLSSSSARIRSSRSSTGSSLSSRTSSLSSASRSPSSSSGGTLSGSALSVSSTMSGSTMSGATMSGTTLSGAVLSVSSASVSSVGAACLDGMDNDRDGVTDAGDPGCYNGVMYDGLDNDETNTATACSDHLDNDGDGKTDDGDPGCVHSGRFDARDDDEREVVTACSDGKDNDGDGVSDAEDPGCYDCPQCKILGTTAVYQDFKDSEDGCVIASTTNGFSWFASLFVREVAVTNLCTCGNGTAEGEEQCDDGNAMDQDACLNTCRAARCGDGFIRTDVPEGAAGSEQCDDANTVADDGCSNSCHRAFCGDGTLQLAGRDTVSGTPDDEECDAGSGNGDTGSCSSSCKKLTYYCDPSVPRCVAVAGGGAAPVSGATPYDSRAGCIAACKKTFCCDPLGSPKCMDLIEPQEQDDESDGLDSDRDQNEDGCPDTASPMEVNAGQRCNLVCGNAWCVVDSCKAAVPSLLPTTTPAETPVVRACADDRAMFDAKDCYNCYWGNINTAAQCEACKNCPLASFMAVDRCLSSDFCKSAPQTPVQSELPHQAAPTIRTCETENPLLTRRTLDTIIIHLQTSNGPTIAASFSITDPHLVEDMVQSASVYDFATPDLEYFDLFVSDALGKPDPNGSYLTIESSRPQSLAGGGIDAVQLSFIDGKSAYADLVTVDDLSDDPLGVPDGTPFALKTGPLTLGFCAAEPQSIEIGECRHDECGRGGDEFCAQRGQTCETINTLPCIRCKNW